MLCCVTKEGLILILSLFQDVPTPNTTQSLNQSPAPNAHTATNMPTNAGLSHVGVTQSNVSSNTQVLLQILRDSVRGGGGGGGAKGGGGGGGGGKGGGTKGVSDAIVLFDTGADWTYVTESLVDPIGSEGVAEIPSICAALQRPSVPDSVLHSLGEGLHFVEAVEGEVKVDILVGQDFYWTLMTPQIMSITPGLIAQHTIFGWVMSGNCQRATVVLGFKVMSVFLISCCAVMSLNPWFTSFGI